VRNPAFLLFDGNEEDVGDSFEATPCPRHTPPWRQRGAVGAAHKTGAAPSTPTCDFNVGIKAEPSTKTSETPTAELFHNKGLAARWIGHEAPRRRCARPVSLRTW